MSLSCECYADYDWYYNRPDDYTTLQTNKRKRCSSCEKLIDLNSVCVQYSRWRNPNNDIEERICGDEVPLADKYLCEKCGDIFFSLIELGFCVEMGDMNESLNEYHEKYNKSIKGE